MPRFYRFYCSNRCDPSNLCIGIISFSVRTAPRIAHDFHFRLVSICRHRWSPTSHFKQESPPIGGAVRNTTSLIPQRLSSTEDICYHLSGNAHARPCMDSYGGVFRDNNTTPAIITRLEYNNCNEK